MPLPLPARSTSSTRAEGARHATHALLDRCANGQGWQSRELPTGPLASARASLWTHDHPEAITWRATTPYTAYTLLLLLADTRLQLHSDAAQLDERACAAGSYYLSAPGDTVSVQCEGACSALRMDIPLPLFWSGDASVGDDFVSEPAHDRLLLQLGRTLTEACDRPGDVELSGHVLELIVRRLYQLRTEAASQKVAGRRVKLPLWRLQRVEAYVRAHLSGPVTLADMANAAGLSPMHFAAQFRAATGYRPHHYLLLCRVDRAKQLMAEPRASMLDVALEVGFQTQSHFTTVFKRLIGKTPGQWRNEARAILAE